MDDAGVEAHYCACLWWLKLGLWKCRVVFWGWQTRLPLELLERRSMLSERVERRRIDDAEVEARCCARSDTGAGAGPGRSSDADPRSLQRSGRCPVHLVLGRQDHRRDC